MEEIMVNIVLSGKEDIFKVEKTLNIFSKHVTQDTLALEMKFIKSSIRQLAKKRHSEVRIYIEEVTGLENSFHHNRTPHLHICFGYEWQGKFEMDYRPWNGRDFGDINECEFNTFQEEMNFTMKKITDKVTEILLKVGNIPKSRSRYSRYLDEKDKQEREAELLNA